MSQIITIIVANILILSINSGYLDYLDLQLALIKNSNLSRKMSFNSGLKINVHAHSLSLTRIL